MLVQRVRKEVEAFAKSMGISTEAMREARRKREQDEAEKKLARTKSTSLVASST